MKTEEVANSFAGSRVGMETVQVENLLLSMSLRGSNREDARKGGKGGKGFKLGATNRREELERKQLIGHVIPAVGFAACVAPQLAQLLAGAGGGQ